MADWTGSNVQGAYNNVSSDAGNASSFQLLNKVVVETSTIYQALPSAVRPGSGQVYPRYVSRV